MISYRSSHKLNSYLIRTESYPINRTVGCYKYGSKRCEVHKYVTETHTFTSNDKWKTFKKNHCFECNDKCLVYLMAFNKCKKQYPS